MTITETARPLLLTIPEAAEHLRVSDRHVRRLLATGELQGVNMGHRDGATIWRISIEALEAFIARHTTD